jgi:hypothetical protein
VLDDSSFQDPVTVDLASGRPAVRLDGLYKAVHGDRSTTRAIPVDSGTMILSTATGTFNFLDAGNTIVNPANTGVDPPTAGPANAYPDGQRGFVVVDTAGGVLVELASRERNMSSSAPVPDALAPGATTPGPGVVSRGHLWLPVTVAGHQTVYEFANGTGATSLGRTDHVVGTSRGGPVPEISAGLGSGDPVAVATAQRIRLLSGPAAGSSVAVAVGGVDRVVPIVDAPESALFAFHSGSSWVIQGIDASGAGTQAVRVQGSRHVPDDTLVTPTYSSGRIFAFAARDAASRPALVSIDPASGQLSGIPVSGSSNSSYPSIGGDSGVSFENEEIRAIGPRVIFNNPSSREGVTYFSDGSRAPLTFDKQAVGGVDPSAPGGVHPQPQNPTQPKAPQRSPQTASHPTIVLPAPTLAKCGRPQVNPITITGVVPAPHALTITWQYTTVSDQDCLPQSWAAFTGADPATSQFSTLASIPTANSSSGASGTTYQGTVSLAGLSSDTSYDVRMEACVPGSGASGQLCKDSSPFTQHTSIQGPDAATSISASGGRNSWTVSWTPCNSKTSSCPNPEPIASWTLTATSCGSAPLAVPFPALSISGATSKTIPTSSTLPAGTGLKFQVQPIGMKGNQPGDPSAYSGCAASYTDPNPSGFTIHPTVTTPNITTAVVDAQLLVPASSGLTPTQAFGDTSASVIFSVASSTGAAPPSQTTTWTSGSAPPSARFTVPLTPGVGASLTLSAVIANGHGLQTSVVASPFSTFTPAINTPAAAPSGVVGQQYGPFAMSASGGTGLIWGLTGQGGAAGLDGLTIDPASGTISGTPSSAGSFAGTVTATESGGLAATPVSVSVTVAASSAVTTTAPTAVLEAKSISKLAVTATVSINNGSGAPSPPSGTVEFTTGGAQLCSATTPTNGAFTCDVPSNVAGLTLGSNPVTATFNPTDSTAVASSSGSLTLYFLPVLAIPPTSLPDMTSNTVPYTQTLTTNWDNVGVPTTWVWSDPSSTLPKGCTGLNGGSSPTITCDPATTTNASTTIQVHVSVTVNFPNMAAITESAAASLSFTIAINPGQGGSG